MNKHIMQVELNELIAVAAICTLIWIVVTLIKEIRHTKQSERIVQSNDRIANRVNSLEKRDLVVRADLGHIKQSLKRFFDEEVPKISEAHRIASEGKDLANKVNDRIDKIENRFKND